MGSQSERSAWESSRECEEETREQSVNEPEVPLVNHSMVGRGRMCGHDIVLGHLDQL